jgi:signal transduction histidine kinase
MKSRAWFRSTRSADTLHAPTQRGSAAVATSASTARADAMGYAKVHAEMHTEMHILLDAMPVGALALDASGRIQSCNAAAAALFGCAVHKLMGQRLANVLPALDALRQAADGPAETLAQSHILQTHGLQSHVLQTHILQAQRLDGATFPLEVRWQRPSSHPAASAASDKHLTIFVLRDVREQQRVDRMPSDFVSVVSHALRAPLTSIRGAMSMLSDGSTGTLPADAQRLIHSATTECERLMALVDDVLDMDKVSNGRRVITPRVHDLVKLLRENLRNTLGFARLHKVRLLMPGHGGPVWALVDAQRINQIMGNLLSNAIKFSPSGADVSVHMELTPVARPTHATIVVSDQGMGIPEHVRDGIFAPLRQGNSAEHGRAQSSMGVGLSVTHDLVKRMGGTIMFECPTAGGTQFYVTFPLAAPPQDGSDFALTGSQELRL